MSDGLTWSERGLSIGAVFIALTLGVVAKCVTGSILLGGLVCFAVFGASEAAIVRKARRRVRQHMSPS